MHNLKFKIGDLIIHKIDKNAKRPLVWRVENIDYAGLHYKVRYLNHFMDEGIIFWKEEKDYLLKPAHPTEIWCNLNGL